VASVLEAVRNKSSLRGRVSAEEWEVRVDLAAAHRFAVMQGWQEPYSIFNHFAARVPGEPNFMLMKPHKLLFSEVTASNLVKMDMKGKPLTFEDDVNAAGFAIHSAVLLARADVNASAHCHGPAGMAIATLKGGLKFCNQETMRFYNRLGYHDFEGIAAMDECERLARDLGTRNVALILRSHGVLTCGASVAAAVMDLAALMRCAEAQLKFMASGDEIIQPSPEICEETARFSERAVARTVESWDAVKRYISRVDASYAE
jgi:ribulose-5-phosphate 4-epimerase/fuculose-1-phosphate aldolase